MLHSAKTLAARRAKNKLERGKQNQIKRLKVM